MIIRGGENIYPAEIEQFLHTHPKVKEAQVSLQEWSQQKQCWKLLHKRIIMAHKFMEIDPEIQRAAATVTLISHVLCLIKLFTVMQYVL